MSHYLSKMNACILYTFVPNLVVGAVPDGTYTINIDNEVVTKVQGGAVYQHQLWDYDSDVLLVDYWWGSVVVKVEHRVFSQDSTRRLILLTPIRKVYGPFAWCLAGKRLCRRVFNRSGILSNCYQVDQDDAITVMRSLAYPDDSLSLNIPDSVLRTACIRCERSKIPSISDIERIFRSHNVANPDYAASMFMQFWTTHREVLRDHQRPVSALRSVDDSVNYQTTYPLITEDAKPVARVVGVTFCDASVAPGISYNNDVACIANRVDKQVNGVSHKTIKPFYLMCMEEFVRRLVPDELVHSGVPEPECVVEEHMTRPTQRADIAQYKPYSFYDYFKVKAFQKKETYTAFKPPRNISTVPTDHKVRYSGYVYAFKQAVMKQQPWYAFGKTPGEIAARMQEVARKAKNIVPTDFSAFDGTHSETLCVLELMTYLRYFGKNYHGEIKRLQQQQYKANASTSFGVQYNTGFSRLSGSGGTSDENSEDNGFVAYCTLRKTRTADDAWEDLGIYGGDDGNTANVSVTTYVGVATDLGLKLKAESILPGNPVPFLGRVYLDPWVKPDSIYDVKRFITKIHLTVAPPNVPDNVVLRRKADSYHITDPNTPLISSWCNAIQRIYPAITPGDDKRYIDRDSTYWSKNKHGTQFPTCEQFDEHAYDIVARQLDVSLSDLLVVCHALDRSNTLDELKKLEHVFIDLTVGEDLMVACGDSIRHGSVRVRAVKTK